MASKVMDWGGGGVHIFIVLPIDCYEFFLTSVVNWMGPDCLCLGSEHSQVSLTN